VVAGWSPRPINSGVIAFIESIMSNPKPILIEPTEELVSEFLMMAKEYQAAGDPSYAAALEDFSSYFSTLL
jgi:hypothetical protein